MNFLCKVLLLIENLSFVHSDKVRETFYKISQNSYQPTNLSALFNSFSTSDLLKFSISCSKNDLYKSFQYDKLNTICSFYSNSIGNESGINKNISFFIKVCIICKISLSFLNLFVSSFTKVDNDFNKKNRLQ